MGKLFPAPLGFAVFWVCGKRVGESWSKVGGQSVSRVNFQQKMRVGKALLWMKWMLPVYPPPSSPE